MLGRSKPTSVSSDPPEPRLRVSYHHIRLHPILTRQTATESSWELPYVGDAADALWRHIEKYHHLSQIHPYSQQISVVQSSGMGKSRMVDEMGKKHFVIPINLRDPSKQGMALYEPLFVSLIISLCSRISCVGRTAFEFLHS